MSKIKALINPVTPSCENAPIIFCHETKHCAFVDPGGDIDYCLIFQMFPFLPTLLTHGHSNAGGASELQEYFRYQLLTYQK